MKPPKYGIFINNYTGRKLIYYPCPKNANTSARLFFAKHLGIEHKFYFIEDTVPRYKKELYQKIISKIYGKNNLIQFMPSYKPFKKFNVDVKCCLIRDPIKRFISSYKNRILFHKDEAFKNHTMDMILEKLEQGIFENKHFLPQIFFLGDNLKYYTFYANVNNIEIFEDKVNEFFGKKIKFPKLQTGGNKFDINLNNKQLDKINKIYEKDIELFK